MILKVKKLYPDAILPNRAYPLDSGLDLYAYIPETVKLLPQERCVIPCGVAVELPPSVIDGETLVVYEGQIRPKSGLAKTCGLSIVNSPGTVDSTYTGELKVIALNTSNDHLIIIKPEQKIAQFVVCPIVIPIVEEVEELGETDRSGNGFGSTGLYYGRIS